MYVGIRWGLEFLESWQREVLMSRFCMSVWLGWTCASESRQLVVGIKEIPSDIISVWALNQWVVWTRQLWPWSTLTVASVETQGSCLIPGAVVEVGGEASCVCTWVGNSDNIWPALHDGLTLLRSGRGWWLIAGDCHWNVPKLACIEQQVYNRASLRHMQLRLETTYLEACSIHILPHTAALWWKAVHSIGSHVSSCVWCKLQACTVMHARYCERLTWFARPLFQ